MLIAVPILSIDAVTVRIRVFLTLLLTLLIYPLVDWPIIDPVSAEGLSEIFNQILIGLVMGFLLQIVSAAVVLGGQRFRIPWVLRWLPWSIQAWVMSL